MDKDSTVSKNLTYEENELIHFEEGLFGFENYKDFLPLSLEAESDATLCLQSVEDETLSFVVMNPFMLCENYAPSLSENDVKKLGSVTEEELSYYVICVIRDTVEDSTINLKCPIVVNPFTRDARQVILEEEQYGFRHPLKEFAKGR